MTLRFSAAVTWLGMMQTGCVCSGGLIGVGCRTQLELSCSGWLPGVPCCVASGDQACRPLGSRACRNLGPTAQCGYGVDVEWNATVSWSTAVRQVSQQWK